VRAPLSLKAYAAATGLLEPFAPLLLKRRLKRGKEDRYRLDERRGIASFERPAGPLVWLHGASVGESLSHLPLVERFVRERSDLAVLVTSGTVTSAQLMARRLPAGVIHQYAPVDTPQAAKRFVGHWRPDLAVFIESEIWPNLLFAARAVDARLALMSGRLSEKSMTGWGRLPGAARALFRLFDAVTVQDTRTGDWIRAHGGKVIGELDLKRLAEPLPVEPEALAALRAAAGVRPVLVAASTHEGEEEIVADVAAGLSPKPLLVVVPRHPERGAAVAEMLTGRGWTVTRRAAGEPLTPEVEAYVADTLGELGLFYRLADAVVVGGSLVEGMTGHNPLEPARLGKAVVSGAHTASFAAAYADLLKQGAVLVAHDAAELERALAALIAEPRLARALGERARAAAAGETEAFDAAWEALNALLPAP